MNAFSTTADFTVVPAPETQWLVLRCAPSQTLRVAHLLAFLGAWVPTWKRMRKVPRGVVRRLTTEACIPSFVFIPADRADLIPQNTPCRPMRVNGATIQIADRQLNAMRSIADKPLVKASELPRPGQVLRFAEDSPWAGLDAKVIRCNQRVCRVTVKGFSLPIQVPPSILHKKQA